MDQTEPYYLFDRPKINKKCKSYCLSNDPSVTDLADLSEQYFGAWTPQKVKDRVTEVLYGWTLWLKEETKIQEAYSMLKKQGLGTHTLNKTGYACDVTQKLYLNIISVHIISKSIVELIVLYTVK